MFTSRGRLPERRPLREPLQPSSAINLRTQVAGFSLNENRDRMTSRVKVHISISTSVDKNLDKTEQWNHKYPIDLADV